MIFASLIVNGTPLPSLVGEQDANVPVHIRVSPWASDGDEKVQEVATATSLAAAADQIASILQSGSRNIIVHLPPGRIRVPPGGLQLTSRHTPPNPAHTVTWLGQVANTGAGARRRHVHSSSASSNSTTRIHGGVNLTGWTLSTDPSMPAGVYTAPVPAELKGKRLRHLFVNGRRANRTKANASVYNFTFLEWNNHTTTPVGRATASACNLTGRWDVAGKRSHWIAVAEAADGSFTATASALSVRQLCHSHPSQPRIRPKILVGCFVPLRTRPL